MFFALMATPIRQEAQVPPAITWILTPKEPLPAPALWEKLERKSAQETIRDDQKGHFIAVWRGDGSLVLVSSHIQPLSDLKLASAVLQDAENLLATPLHAIGQYRVIRDRVTEMVNRAMPLYRNAGGLLPEGVNFEARPGAQITLNSGGASIKVKLEIGSDQEQTLLGSMTTQERQAFHKEERDRFSERPVPLTSRTPEEVARTTRQLTEDSRSEPTYRGFRILAVKRNRDRSEDLLLDDCAKAVRELADRERKLLAPSLSKYEALLRSKYSLLFAAQPGQPLSEAAKSLLRSSLISQNFGGLGNAEAVDNFLRTATVSRTDPTLSVAVPLEKGPNLVIPLVTPQ